MSLHLSSGSSNKLSQFAGSFIYAYSPRLSRSLLDTDQISQSSVLVTKSPRSKGNDLKCILHTYFGQFWAFSGEDAWVSERYLNWWNSTFKNSFWKVKKGHYLKHKMVKVQIVTTVSLNIADSIMVSS